MLVSQVILPTTKIVSFSDSPGPVTKEGGNKLKYGKYDLVKPWSMQEMRLQCEYDKLFKKVSFLYFCL